MITLRLAQEAKQKAHKEGRTITKYVVANETGLSFNTVDSYWENRVHRLDLRVIETLCEYFSCQFADLVQQAEEKENEAYPEYVPVPVAS